mgnify:CR=1 FL=1
MHRRITQPLSSSESENCRSEASRNKRVKLLKSHAQIQRVKSSPTTTTVSYTHLTLPTTPYV